MDLQPTISDAIIEKDEDEKPTEDAVVELTPQIGDVIQVTEGKLKGIVAVLIQILPDATVRCMVKVPQEAPVRFRVPVKFIARIGKVSVPLTRLEPQPIQQTVPQVGISDIGTELAKDFAGAKAISVLDQLRINESAASLKKEREEEAVRLARL